MKLTRILLALSIFCVILNSCKKDSIEIPELAGLKIINLVSGGTTAKLGTNNLTIANNTFSDYSFKPGTNALYIYPMTDSLKPYFNGSVNLDALGVYTLCITGSPTDLDTFLVKESIPLQTDSSFGLRFINLAKGSPSVKVTLSTSVTTSEFGSLGYKQASAFKNYPAGVNVNTYTFQVRNASTDAIITTITLTGGTIATGIPRFHNVTLVLRGVVNGTPAAGITRVNHFI